METLCSRKYKVALQIKENKIKILGMKCKEAHKEILSIINKVKDLKFPKFWINTLNLIVNKEGFDIHQVTKGSQEWIWIQKEFHKTLVGCSISKIERIQNRRLWKVYQTEKEMIFEQDGKMPLERYLYHGTSKTDPLMIYQGEEGFDFRYSTPGMWGKAVYFAVNASYSDVYRYNAPRSTEM